MGFSESVTEFISNNGIRVRSKSELIIANMLEQSGYFLGKNMIMTFETSQHAISSNIIKAMIKEYLV